MSVLHNLVVFSGNSDSDENSDTNDGEPVPVKMKEKPKPKNLNLDYASDNSDSDLEEAKTADPMEDMPAEADKPAAVEPTAAEADTAVAATPAVDDATFLALVQACKDKLPDSPKSNANVKLQAKFAALLEQDANFNQSLQNMKQFHNGKIASKIIERINLQQYSSNMPTNVYDPKDAAGEDNYECLAELLEKAVRTGNRAQTPTIVHSSSNSVAALSRSASGNVRRVPTKWDTGDQVTKKLKTSFDSMTATSTTATSTSVTSVIASATTTTTPATSTTTSSSVSVTATTTTTASPSTSTRENSQTKKSAIDSDVLAQKREPLRLAAARSRKSMMASIPLGGAAASTSAAGAENGAGTEASGAKPGSLGKLEFASTKANSNA